MLTEFDEHSTITQLLSAVIDKNAKLQLLTHFILHEDYKVFFFQLFEQYFFILSRDRSLRRATAALTWEFPWDEFLGIMHGIPLKSHEILKIN